MSDKVRGRMRAEWHVSCGDCGDSQYLDWYDARRAGNRGALAKQMGWRYTKERGWLCSRCFARLAPAVRS